MDCIIRPVNHERLYTMDYIIRPVNYDFDKTSLTTEFCSIFSFKDLIFRTENTVLTEFLTCYQLVSQL